MMHNTHTPEALTGRNDESNLARVPRTIPAREMHSLEEVLAYRNQHVIERYEDELGLSAQEAEMLFTDVLLFLYLCATRAENEEVTPTKALDEGWHQFLMFSRGYREFCLTCFGVFIDHNPFTRAEKARGRGERKSLLRERAMLYMGEALSHNWNSKSGDCDGSCAAECSACRPA